MRRTIRCVALMALAGAWLTMAETPATATFTENTIACQGSAEITDPDGQKYSGAASDAVVRVPNEGVVAYEGSTGPAVHDHNGGIFLDLMWTDVTLGEWSSENETDETSAAGTYRIPDEMARVPPGRYDVFGYHEGSEGRCAGRVAVEVAGSPVTHPGGLAALIATLLFGLGMVASGTAKVRSVE